MSWKSEPERHLLASRGIRTSTSKKHIKSKLITSGCDCGKDAPLIGTTQICTYEDCGGDREYEEILIFKCKSCKKKFGQDTNGENYLYKNSKWSWIE